MSLTSKILIGMFSGLLLGSFISFFGLEANQFIKIYLIDGFLYIGGQVFISLLKLMVVPLVFFSLTSGVSSLDQNLSLGRIAGKTLLGVDKSLKDMRKKIHNYHDSDLIVTYHPAALLRNPNWKPYAWEDFKWIRSILEEV